MFFFQQKKFRNTPVRPRRIYYTGFEFLSSVTFSFVLHKIESLLYRARFYFLPFDSYFAGYNNNSPLWLIVETPFCENVELKVLGIKLAIETLAYFEILSYSWDFKLFYKKSLHLSLTKPYIVKWISIAIKEFGKFNRKKFNLTHSLLHYT